MESQEDFLLRLIRLPATSVTKALDFSDKWGTPKDFYLDNIYWKLLCEENRVDMMVADNKHTKRGNDMEADIIAHFTKVTGLERDTSIKKTHLNEPLDKHTICKPDAVFNIKLDDETFTKVPLEVKCPGSQYEELSIEHYIQCQMEIMCLEEYIGTEVPFGYYVSIPVKKDFAGRELMELDTDLIMALKILPDRELWEEIKRRIKILYIIIYNVLSSEDKTFPDISFDNGYVIEKKIERLNQFY